MNDHFGSILHRDRMATYRAEADAERLLASARVDRPRQDRRSAMRRWVASLAAVLPVFIGRPRAG
jgi:hypothetical protein